LFAGTVSNRHGENNRYAFVGRAFDNQSSFQQLCSFPHILQTTPSAVYADEWKSDPVISYA
jgi:hypothetical protein